MRTRTSAVLCLVFLSPMVGEYLLGNVSIRLEEIDTEAFTDRYGKLAVNVGSQAAAAG